MWITLKQFNALVLDFDRLKTRVRELEDKEKKYICRVKGYQYPRYGMLRLCDSEIKVPYHCHEISYHDLFTLILEKLNIEIGMVKKETITDVIGLVEKESKENE